MAGSRLSGVGPRSHRRWSFANCIFDEANWTLTVDGRRVAVEAKPLELLRVLLLRAGNLVSKDQLLDSIWSDVAVVEASLPTAVGKLRRAINDDGRDAPIIETVPRIGYRLAVPVEVEDISATPNGCVRVVSAPSADFVSPQAAQVLGAGRVGLGSGRPLSLWNATGLAIVLAALTFALAQSGVRRETPAPTSYTQRQALDALRKLDVAGIEDMLAAGWDPNTPFDDQGNGAVNMALNICEWDRRHNQSQLLLVVRTLIDGGAQLDHRNVWGDTAYSIAKAQRYCGPNHPVTNSIRTMCYAGYKPLGDRCLASYEVIPVRAGAGLQKP